MKLIFAIVEDDDAALVMEALSEVGLRVTKLASTGGFLLQGNTTLLSGVEDERVDEALDIIKRASVRRKRLLPQAITEAPAGLGMPVEVESGGTIIFTVPVESFYRG